jgi:hypothetical protein
MHGSIRILRLATEPGGSGAGSCDLRVPRAGWSSRYSYSFVVRLAALGDRGAEERRKGEGGMGEWRDG